MSSLKGRDFFRQPSLDLPAPAPPPPMIPYCDGPECMARANPGWGWNGKTFCRDCAPPELKNPERYMGATDARQDPDAQ